GMPFAGANCAYPAGEAHHVNRSRAVSRGPVAQLAEEVGAPTFHASAGSKCTEMAGPYSDRGYPTGEAANIRRRHRTGPAFRTAGGRDGTNIGLACADRGHPAGEPIYVDRRGGWRREDAAPALNSARRGERAGLRSTGANGRYLAAQLRNVHGDGARFGRAISELAPKVVTPALDTPGCGQRASVE